MAMRNVFKNNGLACLLLGMMVGGGAVGGAWWMNGEAGNGGGDSVLKVLVYGDKADEIALVDSFTISISTGKSGERDSVSQVTVKPDMPVGDSNEEVVYLTPNGSKYHRLGCGSLSRAKAKGNVRELPISKAIRRGYGACGKCFK